MFFHYWKGMVGKLYVYNRPHDLNDFSFIHIASPLLLFLTLLCLGTCNDLSDFLSDRCLTHTVVFNFQIMQHLL